MATLLLGAQPVDGALLFPHILLPLHPEENLTPSPAQRPSCCSHGTQGDLSTAPSGLSCLFSFFSSTGLQESGPKDHGPISSWTSLQGLAYRNYSKHRYGGLLLEVRWLRLQVLPTQGAGVWSLVRELEDEMVGWHHQFNGHELGQTPGDSKRQGGLACCSLQSLKELDMT